MHDVDRGVPRHGRDDPTPGVVVPATDRTRSRPGRRLEPTLRVDEHDADHAEGEHGRDQGERDGELDRDGTALPAAPVGTTLRPVTR